MQKTREIFSNNLKTELQLRRITQAQLAKLCDVTPQTVGEWVNGECLPSLSMFRKICLIIKADANIMLDLDVDTTIPFHTYEIPGLTD